MGFFGVHLLPLGVFFLFPIVFATTYSIAVKQGHIKPFFSYISDTGTYAPEQCWFALGLSIAMLFIAGVAYVRYMQVEEFIRRTTKGGNRCTKVLNRVGLFFGLMAAFGTTMVGSFQELSVLSLHILGAMMAFGGGSIFLIIQGFITKHMAPQFGSNKLAYLRIFIGFACVILFVTTLAAGMQSFKHFTGETSEDSLRWEAHQGGWEWRVLSTVSEWVMAGLFDLYFLTFVPEFKRIAFTPPQFRLVEVSTIKGRGPGAQTVVVMHEPVNSNLE